MRSYSFAIHCKMQMPLQLLVSIRSPFLKMLNILDIAHIGGYSPVKMLLNIWVMRIIQSSLMSLSTPGGNPSIPAGLFAFRSFMACSTSEGSIASSKTGIYLYVRYGGRRGSFVVSSSWVELLSSRFKLSSSQVELSSLQVKLSSSGVKTLVLAG